MSLHAKKSASKMARIMACPGSERESEGIVLPSSPYADEGTRAHSFAQKMLEQDGYISAPEHEEELIAALKLYRDTIYKDIADYQNLFEVDDQVLKAECKLEMTSLHPDFGGTADAIAVFPKADLAYIYDFKYGAGVPVEIDNVQLKYYAVGSLMADFMMDHLVRAFEIVIVQPRCFHPDGPVRRMRLEATELIDFSKQLVEAARRADEPNAPLNPGAHCRWCPAAGVCPELRSQVESVALSVNSTATHISAEQLSKILNRLPLIENWIRSVREFAYAEMTRGNTIPGYKLVEKRPSRKFKAHVTPQFLMGLDWGLNEDIVFEKKFKSVAQIEKCIHPKAKDKFQELWVKESSGSTIAPISDNREAIESGSLIDAFDVVTP